MFVHLLESSAGFLQKAHSTLIRALVVSALLGSSVLPTYALSPSGTPVVDASNAVWTVRDGVIYKDNAKAGYSANVTTLIAHNGVIYQQNKEGNWWKWQDGWKSVASDPRVTPPRVMPLSVTQPAPVATAAPQSSPTPAPTSSNSTPAPVPAPSSARLHVDGKYVKDGNGNVKILRGVSLIGLRNLVAERQGIAHIMDFLTDAGRGWHAKMFRLPVYPSQYLADPGGWNSKYIKPAIDICTAKRIYCIIDWHAFDDPHSAANTSGTQRFWADMANRYKDNPYILFELYNEPVPPETGGVAATSLRWQKWAQARVDEIRRIAPDTIIMVGGPHYSQWMGWAATNPIVGKNIAYVAHIYPGGYYPDANGRNQDNSTGWDIHAGVTADKYPMFITEWGFGDANLAETQGEASTFGFPFKAWAEKKGVSWTAWVSDHQWFPVMFKDAAFSIPTAFGKLAKDWLSEKK